MRGCLPLCKNNIGNLRRLSCRSAIEGISIEHTRWVFYENSSYGVSLQSSAVHVSLFGSEKSLLGLSCFIIYQWKDFPWPFMFHSLPVKSLSMAYQLLLLETPDICPLNHKNWKLILKMIFFQNFVSLFKTLNFQHSISKRKKKS